MTDITQQAVEQAYDSGAEVEMRHLSSKDWYILGPFRVKPKKWKWDEYEYRVSAAPAPHTLVGTGVIHEFGGKRAYREYNMNPDASVCVYINVAGKTVYIEASPGEDLIVETYEPGEEL